MSVAYRQLEMTGRQGLFLATLLPRLLVAQAGYDQHVLFDNSLTPRTILLARGRFPSRAISTLDRGRVPVDTTEFFTPPNALRLVWRSLPDGYWEATL
jgi:exo beta-1,2-glucooligosaccharide sophorohydrolase (non-reducing end)